jgi:MatE
VSSSTSAAGEEVSEPTLGRNVVLSLAGQLAPAVAGLIAFPLLARRLSPDALGLLNIGWLVIGYFTLLDFGLGRAVTQGVATALARAEHRRVRELVWTSWLLVLAIGVPLAIILASGSGWAARRVLDVSPALTGTSVAIITLLAATLPVFPLSTAARAVLEAYGRPSAPSRTQAPPCSCRGRRRRWPWWCCSSRSASQVWRGSSRPASSRRLLSGGRRCPVMRAVCWRRRARG